MAGTGSAKAVAGLVGTCDTCPLTPNRCQPWRAALRAGVLPRGGQRQAGCKRGAGAGTAERSAEQQTREEQGASSQRA
eukprot:1573938-Rhodomonas_salina.1